MKKLATLLATSSLFALAATPALAQDQDDDWFDWQDDTQDDNDFGYDYDDWNNDDNRIQTRDREYRFGESDGPGWNEDDYGYFNTDYDWDTNEGWFEEWYGDAEDDWDLF